MVQQQVPNSQNSHWRYAPAEKGKEPVHQKYLRPDFELSQQSVVKVKVEGEEQLIENAAEVVDKVGFESDHFLEELVG